jgi:hypothetical protein
VWLIVSESIRSLLLNILNVLRRRRIRSLCRTQR